MFFSSWPDLLRTLVVGPLGYVSLLLFLRIAGKRSLSKLNAFDLVITVSLGSALATMFLSKDVTLADGALALGVLLGLQFAVSWSQLRFPAVRRLIKSEPRLLLYDGVLLDEALRDERVVRSEIFQVMRTSGFSSVADIHSIVLETDGTFSVMGRPSTEGTSTLVALPGVEPGGEPGYGGPTSDISRGRGGTGGPAGGRSGGGGSAGASTGGSAGGSIGGRSTSSAGPGGAG